MEQADVLTGELRDGRSLMLDEAVAARGGKSAGDSRGNRKAQGSAHSLAGEDLEPTPPAGAETTMPGIEKTPDICGGDACIAGTHVPVWVLEQARRLGATETDLLADYPSLTATDLAAAWA